MRLLRSLRDSDSGVAVIELALTAPVLAMLTIGLVDISNGMSRKLALEQGAHRAIEKIMTGAARRTLSAPMSRLLTG